jgi:penicillin-binding protein 1C
MARVLNNYIENDGRYFRSDWKMPVLEIDKLTSNSEQSEEQGLLGAGAIWLCMEALTEVNRPETETGWNFFQGSRKVAWKTGTSFGFRDGWAIGTTPDFTVAVWIGNPNGEGRPGLTGIITAAPVLFEVMNLLSQSGWFETPYDDLVKLELCKKSGHIAGPYCNETDSAFVSPAGRTTILCPYHQLIHLSNDRKFRVNSDCYEIKDMKHEPWFILPPAQEWFYRRRDAFYKELPSMHKSCVGNDEIRQMQIIYPGHGSIIYIPRELDGSRGKVVFEAAHRNPEKTIYWHIDDQFIAATNQFHEISVLALKGIHLLSLVDEDGNSQNLKFELIDK